MSRRANRTTKSKGKKRKVRWIWRCLHRINYCPYYLNKKERRERKTEDECLKWNGSCPSRRLVEMV